MYTQCPECEVAFRVTADVLKQAAGKVRCGGCGVAFNALAHLSEEMPVNAARDNPPGEAGTPPQSISAEQSAALLKTLDQLAGEDIRIEDTGVEWRVIDEEEDADIADDPVPSMVHEEMRFDDNTPLPDDFDLDMPAVPPQPPAAVIETAPEPQLEESQVDLVFGEPDEWEGLLEDLDEVAAEAEDETHDPADDIEVVEALPVDAEVVEAAEPAETFVSAEAAGHAEIPAAAAETDDELEALDMDAQFARQAEELGLDMTGLQKAVADNEPDNEADTETEADDNSDEVLLLDEAGEEIILEDDSGEIELADDSGEILFDNDSGELVLDADDDDIDPADRSIEEDLIAAAFEVEAAARAKAEEEPAAATADPEIEADEAEDAADVIAANDESDDQVNEINLDDVAPDELSRAGILDEDDYLDEITEEDEAEVLDHIELEDSPADRALAEAVLDEPAAEEINNDEHDDTLLEAAELEDEAQLPDEEELAAGLEMALDGMQDSDSDDLEDIEVPELSEEEKTVNMMIDQDLLAIAVEDDDGFTSTIVQKQVGSNSDIPAEKTAKAQADVSGDDDADNADADDVAANDDSSDAADQDEAAAQFEMPTQDDNPLMETIIMEGESVINEEEQERLEAARAAASVSLKKAGFDEEKSKFSFRDWQPPKHSMAAAAALLFVVLVIQVIHHSREALAVSPAFQNTIGPVYRLFGSEVTPAWDVTGWRFEATKGSTEDDSDVLTIYSRVGNNSQQVLPYPLVYVELKDRFEEIVGSRVLEPTEYLVDGADPSQPVQPKETFNAVISIDSPSAAATSFKLNVCYRIAGGQLRCDDKDFR